MSLVPGTVDPFALNRLVLSALKNNSTRGTTAEVPWFLIRIPIRNAPVAASNDATVSLNNLSVVALQAFEP
jgi:hypothetical protein